MSVYDRGYMNGTEESTDYSGRRYSAVTLLIAINVGIWVLWQFSRDRDLYEVMRSNFLLFPYAVIHEYKIHTLLTAAFSHTDFWHILFNMLFFWFLGQDVERIYGYRNFIWMYIFCGLFASLSYVGMAALQTQGHLQLASPMLGASGAVMGVVLVAAIFDPRRPMMIFGVIPIQLRWLVAIYIFSDVLGVTNANDPMVSQSRIAHVAHLGGALAGYLYWKMDLRMFGSPGRSGVGFWHKIKRMFRRKPRLRVLERQVPEELPREAVAQSRASRAAAHGASQQRGGAGRVDPATAQRVDQLLDKIHSQGIGALTQEERDFLNQSSQKYKREE